MSNKSYFEKLKDPRWQKKRLKIMERDGFSCGLCYSSDKTLNVYHAFYIKNKNPWEYDDRTLVTLCSGCHRSLTNRLNKVHYITHKAGEFAPLEFFNDLTILFIPFTPNSEKYVALSNIIINIYFHDENHKLTKIFMTFMEKLQKEISKEQPKRY